MATYLNKDTKSKIMIIIDDHLVKKYDKAGTGLEYVRAKATLTKALVGAVRKHIPEEEFKVLQKYGFTEEIREFRYVVDGNEKKTVRKLWGNHSYDHHIKIEFPEHLEVRKGFNLAAFINDKKELHNKAVDYDKLFDLRRCELNDLSYAYFLRLKGCRTVEQLLRKYPDMTDFVKGGAEKAALSETEQKIAAFNKES